MSDFSTISSSPTTTPAPSRSNCHVTFVLKLFNQVKIWCRQPVEPTPIESPIRGGHASLMSWFECGTRRGTVKKMNVVRSKEGARCTVVAVVYPIYPSGTIHEATDPIALAHDVSDSLRFLVWNMICDQIAFGEPKGPVRVLQHDVDIAQEAMIENADGTHFSLFQNGAIAARLVADLSW